MKEQSHKREMRAALQGDFERLRARREDGAEPAAIAPPVQGPPPEREAVQTVSSTMTAAVAVDPPPVRSTWLDRLRDRR